MEKLSRSNIDVDIVEIDPLVVSAAKTYFGLSKERTLFVSDAMEFIHSDQLRSAKKYDMIVHDLFTASANSLRCLSFEALTALNTNLLRDEGVVLVNFVGFYQGSHARLSLSIAATLRLVFSHVKCYADHIPAEHPLRTCNLLCFCSNSRFDFHLPDQFESAKKYSVFWVMSHFQEWEVLDNVGSAAPLHLGDISTFRESEEAISQDIISQIHSIVPDYVWE